jgi:hypothetical protein
VAALDAAPGRRHRFLIFGERRINLRPVWLDG